ncbi:DUF4232 domain-containing protein [Streptomyces sp. NBC_01218]|uniref:DUF4232 domain-containing protein n=1 Tax=unclassified Streptomyces TaxID=2593676 RepID=UPI0023B965A0|nr:MULTISPECIES: DUF4232 domain-containing protein [unclassified Streptomyces]WEH43122.1 DUF4232 domain-containing protein [Streptomyces sp. AM 2-1-1]WSQ54758.1 DUF4232 domain-containing protein [Streptomyces sp. NBC_01218]
MHTKTARAGSVRQGLRGTLWGAAVIVAFLATTACETSEGEADAAPSVAAPAGESAAKSPAPSGDTGTGTPAATGSGSGGSAGQDAGDSGETGGGNGTAHPDCEATDLHTAVESQDAPGQTPRHFLLTVTNGNEKPCVLNDAPLLRLGAGNDTPTVRTLGEPDTEPVVVEGDGTAYAGLYVFGNDEGGEAEYDQADRFTATLVAGEGTELNGTLVFDLPDGLASVSYDDAARVNGWAGTEGLAMRPINQL